jgi:hypothetical protein
MSQNTSQSKNGRSKKRKGMNEWRKEIIDQKMIEKERINEGSKEKGEEKDKNDQYIHPDP